MAALIGGAGLEIKENVAGPFGQLEADISAIHPRIVLAHMPRTGHRAIVIAGRPQMPRTDIMAYTSCALVVLESVRPTGRLPAQPQVSIEYKS